MRLIDADKLLEDAGLFEAQACARGCGKSILHLAKSWLFGEVRKAPTVHPEVRRGKWIDGVCSACGFDAMYYKGMPAQVYTNYCPNCGADMREVEHENR